MIGWERISRNKDMLIEANLDPIWKIQPVYESMKEKTPHEIPNKV